MFPKYFFVLLLLLPFCYALPQLALEPQVTYADLVVGQSYQKLIYINNVGNETMYNITLTNSTRGSVSASFIANITAYNFTVINYAYTAPQTQGIHQDGVEVSFLYKHVNASCLAVENMTADNCTRWSQSPDLNRNFLFIFTVSYYTAEVSVLPVPAYVSVLHNSTKQVVFLIENKATTYAENITLSCDFCNFQDSMDFRLAPLSSKTLIATISTPFVQQTSQTNRSYYYNFSAWGSNFPPVNGTFEVFVPFYPFAAEYYPDINAADFWRAQREFCEDFPNSPYCNPEPVIRYVNTTVEIQKPLALNLTEEDVRRILAASDVMARVDNAIKLVDERIKEQNVKIGEQNAVFGEVSNDSRATTDLLRGFLNDAVVESMREEEARHKASNDLWFFVFLLGLGVGLGVILFFFMRRRSSLSLLGGI